jgi:hypothetical protein
MNPVDHRIVKDEARRRRREIVMAPQNGVRDSIVYEEVVLTTVAEVPLTGRAAKRRRLENLELAPGPLALMVSDSDSSTDPEEEGERLTIDSDGYGYGPVSPNEHVPRTSLERPVRGRTRSRHNPSGANRPWMAANTASSYNSSLSGSESELESDEELRVRPKAAMREQDDGSSESDSSNSSSEGSPALTS